MYVGLEEKTFFITSSFSRPISKVRDDNGYIETTKRPTDNYNNFSEEKKILVGIHKTS